MNMDMTVRMDYDPSLMQDMSAWLWDAYTTQTVIEWNGVKFKVTNMETSDTQLVVELTPIIDE